FFSSRRRHTISKRDWSSDVCSSDLALPVATDVTDNASIESLYATIETQGGVDTVLNIAGGAVGSDTISQAQEDDWQWMFETNVKIGRASCREGGGRQERDGGSEEQR